MAKAVRNNQTGSGKKSDSTQTGKRDGRSGKAAPAKRTSKSAQAKQQAQARSGQKQGFSMARFLRDVRVELSKVTWPTRNELLMSTARRPRRGRHRRRSTRGRSTGCSPT